MTFYSKTGNFDAPASPQSQSITGVGFQPKALIIWGTAQAAEGWSAGTDCQFCYGFATDSTHQGYIAIVANSGVTTTSSYRRMNNSAICGYVQYTGSTIHEGALTSLDADGFTINWTTTTFAPTYHFLALGGSDITNATVVPWTAQTTTGNQDITSPGFQPDVVLHAGAAVASGSNTSNLLYMLGAYDGTNQWAKWGYSLAGQTTSSATRLQVTDGSVVACVGAGTTITSHATGAMLSNGFRLAWDTNSSGYASYYMITLCLKGGKYQVGNWSKSTSTLGPVFDSVAASGISSTSVLLMSDSHAASGSVLTGHRLMIGATDSSNNSQVAWHTDKNGATTTVTKKGQYTTESLQISDNDTATTEALGVISAMRTVAVSGALSCSQGVESDGVYTYGSGATALYKYDSNWNVIATNTNIATQTGDDHCGGITYYDGKIYTAQMNGSSHNQGRIGIFNASDLSFVTYWDVSAQGFDPSGCAADPDHNILWVTGCYNNPQYIYQYNLTTGAYIGAITPSPTISCVQDIKYYDGNLYLSLGYNPLYTDILKMNTSGGAQSYPLYAQLSLDEGEGFWINSYGITMIVNNDSHNPNAYLFQKGGFAPFWSTNNAVATQICYVLFGYSEIIVSGVTASISPSANVSQPGVSVSGVTATVNPTANSLPVNVSIYGVSATNAPTAYVSVISTSTVGITATAHPTANVGVIPTAVTGVTAVVTPTANVPVVQVSILGVTATAKMRANTPLEAALSAIALSSSGTVPSYTYIPAPVDTAFTNTGIEVICVQNQQYGTAHTYNLTIKDTLYTFTLQPQQCAFFGQFPVATWGSTIEVTSATDNVYIIILGD